MISVCELASPTSNYKRRLPEFTAPLQYILGTSVHDNNLNYYAARPIYCSEDLRRLLLRLHRRKIILFREATRYYPYVTNWPRCETCRNALTPTASGHGGRFIVSTGDCALYLYLPLRFIPLRMKLNTPLPQSLVSSYRAHILLPLTHDRFVRSPRNAPKLQRYVCILHMIYAGVSYLIHLAVNSFVDRGNNGLDGVSANNSRGI